MPLGKSWVNKTLYFCKDMQYYANFQTINELFAKLCDLIKHHKTPKI